MKPLTTVLRERIPRYSGPAGPTRRLPTNQPTPIDKRTFSSSEYTKPKTPTRTTVAAVGTQGAAMVHAMASKEGPPIGATGRNPQAVQDTVVQFKDSGNPPVRIGDMPNVLVSNNPNDFEAPFILVAATAKGITPVVSKLEPGSNAIVTANGFDPGVNDAERKHVALSYAISLITSGKDSSTGVVTAAQGGELQIARDSPHAGAMKELFKGTPIGIKEVDDIMVAKYQKAALNSVCNSIALIFGMTLGELHKAVFTDSANPRRADSSSPFYLLIGRVVEEVMAVSRGLEPNRQFQTDDAVSNSIYGVMEKNPVHKTSMQNTFLAGGELEIDVLNGAVSQLGKAQGIPTPINDLITEIVFAYVDERKASKSSGSNDLSTPNFHADHDAFVRQKQLRLLETVKAPVIQSPAMRQEQL